MMVNDQNYKANKSLGDQMEKLLAVKNRQHQQQSQPSTASEKAQKFS